MTYLIGPSKINPHLSWVYRSAWRQAHYPQHGLQFYSLRSSVCVCVCGGGWDMFSIYQAGFCRRWRPAGRRPMVLPSTMLQYKPVVQGLICICVLASMQVVCKSLHWVEFVFLDTVASNCIKWSNHESSVFHGIWSKQQAQSKCLPLCVSGPDVWLHNVVQLYA